MKYTIEEFNPKNNKTVCGASWCHLHLFADNKAYPCCMNVTTPMGDYGENTLKEIWNNDTMTQFRVDTLNGIPQKGCEPCYEAEQSGQYSYRESFWDKIKNNPEILESTNEDGSLDEMNLLYWDFRFSNVCDLKCRTCDPAHSSTWGEEMARVNPDGMKGLPILRQGTSAKILAELEDDGQYEKANEVYFAGGEPLVAKEHYILLEKLDKHKRNDIKLWYNTNFMNLYFKKSPVWKWWNKFSDIRLQVSIDGIGDRGSYIRKGFDSNKFEANLKEVRENAPHVKMAASVTISLLNSFHLFDLFKELIFKYKIEPDLININFVFWPQYYCIQNLPTALKDKWLIKYEQEMLTYTEDAKKYGNIITIFEQIKSFIFQKETSFNELKNFMQYTKFYDAVRNEEIYNVFPELNTIIFEVEKLEYLEEFKNAKAKADAELIRITTNLDVSNSELTEMIATNEQLISDLKVKNLELENLTKEKSELIGELTFHVEELKSIKRTRLI
jgi:organic radical activating enzyme